MTADWVAALHRTKERAEGDEMNDLLRGRPRVDAADQPEPATVAALHRTKTRAAHDQMNAFLRGRGRVDDAEPDAEPATVAPVDFEGGARGSPAALPPPGMNELLRAHVAAHRRDPQPEDYQ